MVRIVVLFGVRDISKIMLLWPIMSDLLFVACFAYDFATRRKVIGQPTVLAWPAWTNFANALQRLVA
jgi:hypothetical protein